MAQKLVFQGTEYVAGIEWGLKSSPSRDTSLQDLLKKLRPERRDGYVLHWGNRIATTNDSTLLGLGSLAQAVALALPQDLQSVNVLVAMADEAGKWAAAFVLASGRPAVGSETLFENSQALVTHCVSLLAEGEIDVLYHTANLTDDFPEQKTESQVIEVVETDPRQLAAFKKAITVNPVLALATVGAIALFVGVQYLPDLTGPSLHTPTTAPLQRVSPDWAAFSDECSDALNTRWPLIPGWQVTTTGCTPPALFGGAKAYKTFTIVSGHNETIATRIAQVIYAHWPRPVIVNGSTITIEEPLQMHWNAARPASARPESALDFEHRVARRFVGVLASIGSATVDGRPAVRISTAAGYKDAFSRFLALPGADLLSITRTNAKTALIVAPARTRLRPVPTSSQQGASS